MMQHLRDWIPDRYHPIPQLATIIDAEDPEVKAFRAAVMDLLEQFDVDTATWGLAYFERDWGIQTDLSLTLDERRGTIKAKMRGTAVSTATRLEIIADAYGHSKSTVTEFPRKYLVRVLFNGEYGLPTNMTLVRQVLREMTPAHLGLEYYLLYPLRERMFALGCVMGSILTTPVPEAADVFDFTDTIRVGGAASTITESPVSERPDAFVFCRTVHIGGAAVSIAVTPVQEHPDTFNLRREERFGELHGVITRTPIPEI